MKEFDLDKSIHKINKIEIVASGFLSIGLVALVSSTSLVASVALGIPMLANSVANYVRIKKENRTNVLYSFTGSLYRNKLSKKISNYLNESDDPQERSYKLFLLSCLFHRNDILLDYLSLKTRKEIVEISASVRDLKKEVIQLFDRHDIVLNTEVFLDKNNQSETIKKILKDFENEGLLGNMFSNFKIREVNILTNILNEQLTENDLIEINKKIKQNENTTFYTKTILLENEEQEINDFILKQNSIKGLDVLENLFGSLKEMEYAKSKKLFNESIDIHRRVIKLKEELKDTKIQTRKMKI